MIPLLRPRPKSPRCVFQSMSRSRTPKLGVGSLMVIALVISADAFAQQSTVLKNVTVLDGSGKPAQRNRPLVIEGDRIQSIGVGDEHVPSSAKLVDMHGQTIMPLIINTHGHLGLTRGTTQSAANETDDNIRHQLLRYQEYGVGAVLSMGTDGKRFAEVREESRRGALPGADVYTAGMGFGAKNGVPPAAMGFTDVFRPETPAEARRQVAQEVPQKPDFIKVWVDDFWGQYPKMPPEIYGAIIDEAHKNGLRVAAHVYHLEDARLLVADGVDVLAHSIRDGDVDDALIAEMEEAQCRLHSHAFAGRFRVCIRRFAPVGSRSFLHLGIRSRSAGDDHQPRVQSEGAIEQSDRTGASCVAASDAQFEEDLRRRHSRLIRYGFGSNSNPNSGICRTHGIGADGPGGSHTHPGDRRCHVKRSQAAAGRRPVRNAGSKEKGQFHRSGKGPI